MSHAMLIIDAHVHVYPHCDLLRAIATGTKNMDRWAGQEPAVRVWLLTERSDCQFFASLAERNGRGELLARPTGDQEAWKIESPGNGMLFIIAGRQIISREGLEICALVTPAFVPDRQLSAQDLIEELQRQGAVIALNWAPGKWFGARGQIVRQLLAADQPALFISDTTMRPTVWQTPKLMQAAKKRGIRLLYGSDPLPFSGEEKMFGRYATRTSGLFDAAAPATSIKALLADPRTVLEPVGRRSGPLQFAMRQGRIMREKKKRG